MSRLTSVSLSLALIAAVSLPAFAKTEKDFLSDAIKGDNSEIAMGQLALANGGAQAMKTFGQTLINDHSKNKTEAEALASKLGLSPPSGMTPEAQQAMAKLEKLKGREFDREFSQLMVKDHEKTISEFKAEATSEHGPVQQFASQSLPTLEKHLRMAKDLEAGKAATD